MLRLHCYRLLEIAERGSKHTHTSLGTRLHTHTLAWARGYTHFLHCYRLLLSVGGNRLIFGRQPSYFTLQEERDLPASEKSWWTGLVSAPDPCECREGLGPRLGLGMRLGRVRNEDWKGME